MTPVAFWIHAHSVRRAAKLEVVDLSGPHERSTLLEGAAAGPVDSRHDPRTRGTILVTRVDRWSLQMQEDLFRLLETCDAFGRRPRRVIAATEGSVLASVQAGRFREDLFYRLNGIHIILNDA